MFHQKVIFSWFFYILDAHQTEYVAKKDERRAWVSEFTGSAGIALITLNKKKELGVHGDLWTDGRYFLQAEAELNLKHWRLFKQGQNGVFSLPQRLIELSAMNGKLMKVGIDFRLISYPNFMQYTKVFEQFNVELVDAPGLIDEVRQFEESKEVLASQAVFVHKIEYAGESVSAKLGRIRNILTDTYKEAKSYSLVISDLSEICWLFNLRGRNIVDYCPVFIAFAIVLNNRVLLFSNLQDGSEDEITEMEKHLNVLKETVNLEVFSYNSFETHLVKECAAKEVILSPNASQKVFSLCMSVGKLIIPEVNEFVSLFKAMKNEVELENMRETSIIDSVAMVRYLHWLETNITDQSSYDEVDVADVLEQFRSEGKYFAGLSFPTISSYGSNGAIIHYCPKKGDKLLKKVEIDSLYLCDSGAQYSSGGTTDVTRTICFKKPTEEMQKYFTLVLDGHAQLALNELPPGTNLAQLDKLARAPLQAEGANYAHGTSHGVGSFLNVHEQPVGYGRDVIEEGMCFSNEPGFYKDNHWGIRIESVVVAIKKPESENLLLETLNYIPMQRELIDTKYLSEKSRKWLNNYHKQTLDIVGPRLKQQGFNDAHDWLKKVTLPI